MRRNGDAPDTDGALVRAALAGDHGAADRLVERHYARARRAAYAVLGDRESAEDAAQNAVERGFRALGRFDQDRPFGPWIATIAAREAMRLRGARPHDAPLDASLAGPGDAFADMRERDAPARAVAALAPERRDSVALRHRADMDPRPTAGDPPPFPTLRASAGTRPPGSWSRCACTAARSPPNRLPACPRGGLSPRPSGRDARPGRPRRSR